MDQKGFLFIEALHSKRWAMNYLAILKLLHLEKSQDPPLSLIIVEHKNLQLLKTNLKLSNQIVKSHIINSFLLWDPIVLKVRFFELCVFWKKKNKLSPKSHKLSMNFVFDKPKEISVTCVSKATFTWWAFPKV